MFLSLKHLARLILIAATMLFILAACAPAPTSQAVEVPAAIVLAIGALVLAVLTAGFVYIFELTRLDLRGFATPVSVTVSAYLVAQLQGIINTIPAQYDPFLTVLFQIIVVIIGGLGVLRLRSNERARLL
jgi:hypothetical protein